jgi:hypothetical protein
MATKLVCTRIDSTKEFSLQGGKFKIGILPRGIYADFVEAGQKQVNGSMSGSEMLDLQTKIVKHAIKGHTGLEFEDGTDVPFETDAKGQVSDATIEIYYATQIIQDLFNRVVTGESSEDADPKE